MVVDPIAELRMILRTWHPADSFARVTVPAIVWHDLRHGQIVSETVSGWKPEELGPPIDSGDMLRLSLVPDQVEPFRLWSREGEEVTGERGRIIAAARERSNPAT
jgi:hypothetical protein